MYHRRCPTWPPLPQPVALRLFLGVAAPHLHLLLLLLLLLLQHESIALNYVSNIRWIVFLNHHVRKHGSNAWNYLFSHNFSESPINYHIKRTKTLVEGYARCITENITKRWLRQTLVVERGIAVSYKYNPLASVPVPEICVPVLCSRAQKVAVIVIKRKCRLIPDLPAPVAQLFVPGGSVDIMTNPIDLAVSRHLGQAGFPVHCHFHASLKKIYCVFQDQQRDSSSRLKIKF